jgi:hypothetical protein
VRTQVEAACKLGAGYVLEFCKASYFVVMNGGYNEHGIEEVTVERDLGR